MNAFYSWPTDGMAQLSPIAHRTWPKPGGDFTPVWDATGELVYVWRCPGGGNGGRKAPPLPPPLGLR
jgi:hypothetical protein